MRKFSFLLLFITTVLFRIPVLHAQVGTNPTDTVKFAFLTDLHVSPGTASESELQKLVAEINLLPVDFTVVTGDITNTGSNDEFRSVKTALDKLVKPCYIIPGNHETNWSESAGLKFNELWGNDRFTFSLKGFRFIGFNTGPFMKMGDGHIKEEDIRWLARETEPADPRQILIVFAHYPLNEGLDNWEKATEILKKDLCRAVFCGHGHLLTMLNFDGIPGIMGRAMISGKPGTTGYNLVEIRNDSIFVSGKLINKPAQRPDISFNYLNTELFKDLPVSTKPDYSINANYRNIRETVLVEDTASIFTGPCLVNDTLLVYGNSLGWIKAFQVNTRQLLWELKVKGPAYSTPVASKNSIAFGTVDGKIIGVEALTGKIKWTIETGSPVLAEGIIENGYFFIGADKAFYKIELETGNVAWKYGGISGLVQGKPAIAGKRVIFGAWDCNLYCLDKYSGKLCWKWNNGKPQSLYSPGNIAPVSSFGKVFIVAPDRYMTSLDLKTGKQIWRTNRYKVRESMGISPDGKLIYAKLMNDSIIAVAAKPTTFRTYWAADAGMGYEHSPCPVVATKQSVIFSTKNGMVIALDPLTQKIRWKYKTGNSSVNKLVINKVNAVWLSLTEGKIIALTD